jgi:threonine dehydratase
VFLSFKLETANREEEVGAVLSQLRELDMRGFDISDDELAKSHARYMIGGRINVPNERIFRFGTLWSILVFIWRQTNGL